MITTHVTMTNLYKDEVLAETITCNTELRLSKKRKYYNPVRNQNKYMKRSKMKGNSD